VNGEALMINATVTARKADGEATLLLQGAEEEATRTRVAECMRDEHYGLESGAPYDGVYGKGSAALRFLFGAFARRFKFEVTVYERGDAVEVRLKKAMTGYSGGLIGLSRMNREFDRLADVLLDLFGR
jgi:hypothetical protein